MAPPPRIRAITRESAPGAPEWFDGPLNLLNQALNSIASAFDRQITRTENLAAAQKLKIPITTLASVASTWPLPIKNELGFRPNHVVCTQLTLASGGPPPAVWSLSWQMNDSGQIELSFQGLSASSEYLASIAYE